MKTKSLILTTIFICFVMFLKAQAEKKNSGISPKFENFNGILLVQCKSTLAGVARVLEKKFTKFYKGEFQMVDRDDENAASVGSPKSFPFLVFLDDHMGGSNIAPFKLTMVDRDTGEKFETYSFAANTLPPWSILNKYIKVLEDIRAK